MKLRNLIFVFLVGCVVPIQSAPKQELTIRSAQKTPCELKQDVIRSLAGECYIEIQNDCISDSGLGRQPGDCPSCDALDKAQKEYNEQCASKKKE